MTKAILCGLVLALMALAAVADEAQIRKMLESKLPGAKVEGVQPGPIGLFEVRVRTAGGPVRLFYTDAAGTYLFVGKIYDTQTDRDLTDERLRKLNAVKFDSLPLDQAVKVQRGNGKRVIAMFSDPYCPYCKRFEKTLQNVDDVTIYVFMFPVIRPDLADQSKSIWCAPDRAKAWIDLALNGKPPAPASCANPVDKNLELGRRIGVNSTPTLIFANGERVAGAIELADLTDFLKSGGPR